MSGNGISRVTRSKAEAKASYDRISKWYDMFGFVERRYAHAGLRKLGAREGEAVLEIGFGTGHCILALARSVGNSGRVYAIDISEGMCNVAQARVDKAGLRERVELRCGDAARLPFTASSLDAVFMSFTLELFDTPEIPTVLQECRRVLRRDGRICVVAMSREGKANVITRLYEWAHAKFPEYVDCRPISVRKALKDAGFRVVDMTLMSMVGLPVEIAVAICAA